MRARSSTRTAFDAALLTAASIVIYASSVEAAPQRITAEQLLRAEDFGEAAFSPDGGRFAYEHMVARADLTSTAIESDGLDDRRVFVMRRGTDEAREVPGGSRERFALAPYTPWSPDGRWLALTVVTNGAMHLAVWDSTAGKPTRLPGRPPSFYPRHLWLAGDKLAYLSLPSGVPQRFSHEQMLEHAVKRWRKGWNGEVATTVRSANPQVAATVEPSAQLFVADLADSSSKAVGEGDYKILARAPDGSYFATVRLAERASRALDPSGRRGELELFKVSDAGVKRTRRFDGLDVARVAWKPDSKQLLFGALPGDTAAIQPALYVLDLLSGELMEIRSNGLSFVDPDPYAGWASGLLPIGWINGWPAAVAGHPGTSSSASAPSPSPYEYGQLEGVRLDVFAFNDGRAQNLTEFSTHAVTSFTAPEKFQGALVIANGALWHVHPNTAAERLSPQAFPTILGFAVDDRYPEPPDDSAYYRGARGIELVALLVQGDGSEPDRAVLRLSDGSAARTKPGCGGHVIASSPDLRATLEVHGASWTKSLELCDAGSVREIAMVNGALRSSAVGPVHEISYEVGERPLKGWVLMPPGTGTEGPLPAIVRVYGGAVWHNPPPETRPSLSAPVFNGQLHAASGYAVIYPSTPLGRGADTDIPAVLAEQVIAAVDAAAAAGLVDPERVGLLGQSFGGYSTAAILGERPDRFRAGVALAGTYDWMASYGAIGLEELFSFGAGADVETFMTYVESGQPGLGSPFWENPEAYMRMSPIFNAGSLKTPLLMLHGDMDIGPTSFVGAERMFAALTRAEQQPVLVRYWGEGHQVRSYGGVRDQWRRISEWFESYLKGETARRRPDR